MNPWKGITERTALERERDHFVTTKMITASFVSKGKHLLTSLRASNLEPATSGEMGQLEKFAKNVIYWCI